MQDRVRLRILYITSPYFVLVRLWILSISSPGPGPDLLSMSGYASASYQHPDDKAKTVLHGFTSAVSLLSYNSRFVNWCQHVSRVVPLTFSVS